MVNSIRSLRRRTLRPTNGPTLIEGAMTRSNSDDYVTVEIAGGPPWTTATVLVAGAPCGSVRLDGCGTGSVQVAATSHDSCIDIAVEDRVLLTGQLPAAPSVDGSRS